MLRKLAALVICAVAVLAFPANAAKPDANVPITIMTQNMDDGTDLTFIIGALAFDALPIGTAVDLTYEELQYSAFALRAAAMAAEIATKHPEMVALQEAALWRIGPTPETATTVLFDQLELLVSALRSAGAPYDVVAVNHLSDLALQGDLIGGALRFTDRNAMLIRSDLRPPQFHLSNVHARTFKTALPFAGMQIPAGWISADVHVGNKQFRLVTTHLETAIQGVPEATLVQTAQAQELIYSLRNLTIPVVICGDFNSDALHGGFIDSTPTVDLIEAAGYAEVWPATHDAADKGLTWPYYLEDQYPPPYFVTSAPFERIDLFFSKGMQIVSSELAFTPMPPIADIPTFASDHSGVVAVFRFR
ncbi:MAG TPA: endonuclease/exonuclease/phosphatase family protein [Thermoanaerobaculia bacterium]|jgi:endonuclease/exonuclease/phosphatase family metal-dependent hydrolase